MISIAQSVEGISIRLTDERWAHITDEHRELTGLKWVVVVYREKGDDGFVITAFLTRRTRSLEKRKQLWP
jgi:hypothetical protein